MTQTAKDHEPQAEATESRKKDQQQLEEVDTDSTVVESSENGSAKLLDISERTPDEFKDLGNVEFKAGHFGEAVRLYTLAIDLCLERRSVAATEGEKQNCGNMAVYLCNRAFAQTKLENFGSAIVDATEALKLTSNSFPKAFYRRGVAHLCLTKYKLAVQDFKSVCTLQPKDLDAAKRFKEAQKLFKEEQFSKAIHHDKGPSASQQIDISSISISEDYKGPKIESFENLDLEFFKSVLEYLKVPGNILHRKYALMIVLQVLRQFKELKNVVMIDNETDDTVTTVCGDVHGQFYDLLTIFSMNGYPSAKNKYLFNGDFVDRGSFSVEIIVSLYLAKLIWPDYFFLARGNHESRRMTHLYGFEGEVRSKYNETVYELFCESFEHLPLAHVINEDIFVVHGGLSTTCGDAVTINDIQALDRVCEPDDGLMSDLLWADPQKDEGSAPSQRGVSTTFGPDWTDKFLKTNNLKLIVRSHEMKLGGYEWHHDRKTITVFSAPNYCDHMQNLGAFLRFKGRTLPPEIITFAAVEHPPVRSMKYASPLLMG